MTRVSAMFLLFSGLACANAGAWAASPAPLDLSLPDETGVAPFAVVPGAPLGPATDGIGSVEREQSLADDNDGKTHVHGSISMGIGDVSGHGSTTSEAGEVSIDKTTQSGSRINLNIAVEHSQGFANGWHDPTLP